MIKPKVLWWSDSPTVTTGFGNVARNLLKGLEEVLDVTVIGIAHNGDPYNREVHPYPIYPAQTSHGDVYGRKRLMEMLVQRDYDFLFLLHDTFIVKTFIADILTIQKKKKFKIVYYFPIDCTPRADWILETVSKVDIPVAYSHYGYNECTRIDPTLKDKLHIVYHGTDKKAFFRVPDIISTKFRTAFFGANAGKKIFLNVNRNQQRKDLIRTFEAFSIYQNRSKQNAEHSFLYILAQQIDVGGDLREIADQFGLVYGEDWLCPPPAFYQAGKGIPEDQLNLLYNACDVFITTSLGEGWGLSTTEAMATGLPIIAPRHTAFIEILGEFGERGRFCKAGGDGFNLCMGPIDNNRIRPLVNTSDLASKMAEIDITKTSHQEWIPSWGEITTYWKELFDC